jgi:hypothetical protein
MNELKQHIVVFNEKTGELLIDIPLHDMEHSIAKSGVGFSFYDGGAEPVYKHTASGVQVNHNACIIRLGTREEGRQ